MMKNTAMTALLLKSGTQVPSHAIAPTISNMNGKITVATNALKTNNTSTKMNATNAHRVTASSMKVYAILALH